VGSRCGALLALLLAAGCLSVPQPAAKVCDELFGGQPGYVLCEETADRCAFDVVLDDRSCRAFCTSVGSACLASHDVGADLCEPAIELSCDAPRASAHCVCTTATSSCALQFGQAPGYQQCSETADSCRFFVQEEVRGTVCNDICAAGGGSCLAAGNGEPEAPCTETGTATCDQKLNDQICICSRTP
jgi:hypothetical protein